MVVFMSVTKGFPIITLSSVKRTKIISFGYIMSLLIFVLRRPNSGMITSSGIFIQED